MLRFSTFLSLHSLTKEIVSQGDGKPDVSYGEAPYPTCFLHAEEEEVIFKQLDLRSLPTKMLL